MAGTTILSGSLKDGPPTTDTQHRATPCTVDATVEAVELSLFSDSDQIKRRAVLAAYALHSLQMDSDRYKTKFLLPLRDPEGLGHCYERVGDFTISDENGDLFECIQITGILLTPASVEEAFAQVSPHAPHRFCLLTTAGVYDDNKEALRQICDNIYQTSGCEVIVDGLMPTLNYGVRSLPEPANFLAAYSRALQEDILDSKTP